MANWVKVDPLVVVLMSHEQVDAFMSIPVGAYVDCFKIDLGESVKATKDSMVPSEYDLVRIGDRGGIEVCVST